MEIIIKEFLLCVGLFSVKYALQDENRKISFGFLMENVQVK